MEWTEIRKKLKKALDKDRYEHTKGVTYTAGCLAMAHDGDIRRAMLAGLLHDCAKCIPNEEKIRVCERNDILLTGVELANPSLIHAKLGAYLAKSEYGVTDTDILHAIRVHTTGAPDMNLLDKIIYVADYIEPGRDRAVHLEQIRRQAFSDLNACVAMIAHDTLCYEQKRGSVLDPATQLTYEFYRQYEIQ